MHDAEIVVELYALARESHVRISEHVAAVLVLEHDDEDMIEGAAGAAPGSGDVYPVTSHFVTPNMLSLAGAPRGVRRVHQQPAARRLGVHARGF
jgi:hypothetical protein